jgi:uncharacterized membrane protein
MVVRRYPLIDALRGMAIASMFAYHFCFDLNYFGALHADFNHDLFWLAFRTAIVSLFLGLMGISLILANVRGFRSRPYWARLGRIGTCALLVTAGSYAVFPRSFIYFGILHFIAAASVLALPFIRLHWTNLALGAAVIVLASSWRHPLFDSPWLHWFGLMTFKPVTEDYVPLVPWFGVVLLGMFVARSMLAGSSAARVAQWQPRSRVGRILALAGRHSLLIYMVHQPLFIAVLYAARAGARLFQSHV